VAAPAVRVANSPQLAYTRSPSASAGWSGRRRAWRSTHAAGFIAPSLASHSYASVNLVGLPLNASEELRCRRAAVEVGDPQRDETGLRRTIITPRRSLLHHAAKGRDTELMSMATDLLR